MTDTLTDRCAELAQPVVDLMAAVIECETGRPDPFETVIRLSARLRAVAESGAAGIDQPDYASWSRAAPAVLAEMERAAQRRDAAAVWQAFTDRAAGLHLLGTACAGQPGW